MIRAKLIIISIVILGIISSGYLLVTIPKQKVKTESVPTQNITKENMQILSPAFEQGKEIPSVYTCDGSNINPPLTFLDVPQDAKSLALTVIDPDTPSGDFVHWLIWNINTTVRQVDEGNAPNGVQGKNDFGDLRYGGPCPPSGTHRYNFTLYALDINLDLPPGSPRSELENIIKGHILTEAVLTGTYTKK